MEINSTQVGKLLGVSAFTVDYNWRAWGLTVAYTSRGKRRYQLVEVVALAKRWAEEAEQRAATLRGRVVNL